MLDATQVFACIGAFGKAKGVMHGKYAVNIQTYLLFMQALYRHIIPVIKIPILLPDGPSPEGEGFLKK